MANISPEREALRGLLAQASSPQPETSERFNPALLPELQLVELVRCQKEVGDRSIFLRGISELPLQGVRAAIYSYKGPANPPIRSEVQPSLDCNAAVLLLGPGDVISPNGETLDSRRWAFSLLTKPVPDLPYVSLAGKHTPVEFVRGSVLAQPSASSSHLI